jgi:hypothetical protein
LTGRGEGTERGFVFGRGSVKDALCGVLCVLCRIESKIECSLILWQAYAAGMGGEYTHKGIFIHSVYVYV